LLKIVLLLIVLHILLKNAYAGMS